MNALNISALVMPVMICTVTVYALIKGTDVFGAFCEGGSEGLKNAVMIAPSVMGLVVGVTMMRETGTIDLVVKLLGKVTDFFNIPLETVPLMVLRPVSGSGSLALLDSMLKSFGADSYIGRVASTVMGGTETTFYAISVYLGAAGVNKKTAKIIACALLADFVCFIVSVNVCRFM